jgi:mRNA-degrading endonuclease toxin of MazEF toxin-antitoxin module
LEYRTEVEAVMVADMVEVGIMVVAVTTGVAFHMEVEATFQVEAATSTMTGTQVQTLSSSMLHRLVHRSTLRS